MTKSLVKNNIRIHLAVEVFTNDDTPKKISENKAGSYFNQISPSFNFYHLGKAIIQSEKDSFLVNGEAIVGRLKINEVSSHFSKGLFNLCVFCTEKNWPQDSDYEIDGAEIKPLIISNIKVKSKK